MRQKGIKPFLFALPLLALGLLLRSAHPPRPDAETLPHTENQHTKKHLPAQPILAATTAKKPMSTLNVAVSYGLFTTGTIATPAAATGPNAGNLYDHALGDTSSGVGDGSHTTSIIFDAGVGNTLATSSGTFQLEMKGVPGETLAYVSDDGLAWTQIGSTNYGSGTFTLSAGADHRFFQAAVYTFGAVSDCRIISSVQTYNFTSAGTPMDTTPPTPLSAAINPAGTQLTLHWTETETPPVLQAGGHGTNQGLTLTTTGGVVTVSSVSTTSTTTTATLSRTVTSDEILTLSGGAGSFTDSAATPNATAAFSGLSITNSSAVETPAHEQHVFSTGTLTVGYLDGLGAPQTALLAVLQDVSFEAGWTRKDLYDAATITVFPIDTADHEGHFVIKGTNASINAITLQLLIASALTSAGGKDINTVSGQVNFPVMSATLALQDTVGKAITVVATRVRAIGDAIQFKLSDFAMQNFELRCYPDLTLDAASGGRVARFIFEK